ncbi:MAG: sensor domain-containing diguanylate cyclase [Gammaproteobacteria bacterium]|nr:diguanylate cyclase [Sideroxydans sp.]MBU3904281.1 sensor domain-containing diguanylate cyclase [Gammaproteobacteria bacterium]MBU4044797.1 sensor domain-containing diguanylate cyclase [Gammaproteobacteria bacterium]MBU4150782.1 sensor domain-containing diguanylate cyclase [Gammaproteobacteria bacterium]
MRLTTRFLLLRAVVFVVLGVLVWLSFDAVVDRINMQWGREFAQRQVLFDKYRTLSPLIREIELARKMAAEPALIGMALNEHDPLARKRGLQVLEEYRYRFREHSYFAAFAHSGNYYYNDDANAYAGKQLRYTLNPKSANDQWFYATLQDGMDYQVNVDPDVHLDVVKVWINVLLKQRGKVLGVVGTGIELTDFLKESVDIHQPGVDNFFVDKSLAIQLSTDPAMIDYASLTKEVDQRIRIDRLFTRPADMAAIQRTAEALRSKPDGEIATLWVHYQSGRHLLGMAWLPELGWYDLTLMDEQSLSMLHEYNWVPMLFVMLFLAALMLFGWLFNRWALTPICRLNQAMRAIQSGDDKLEPPIVGKGEVEALSHSFRQMVETVRGANHALERKVQERTEALQRLSEVDPLTGLLNRRGMMARFEQEISRQARQDGTLGLLLLDLDHFKDVNDTYGHAAGDLALCAAAKVLGGVMRAYDHAARWGGEEFLILLPDCSEEDLLAIAERIRTRIEALKIETGQHQFSFTASIGAHRPLSPQTPDAMLQQVDRALYAAKADGRNCVRLSSGTGKS